MNSIPWGFFTLLSLSILYQSTAQQHFVKSLEEFGAAHQNGLPMVNDAYLKSLAKARYSDQNALGGSNQTRIFTHVNPKKRDFWNQMICNPLGKENDCEIDRADLATQLPQLSATCTQNLLFLGAEYHKFTQALYFMSLLCGGNKKCIAKYKKIFDKTEWTAKQLDAFGKVGTGLMDGNYYWWGNYEECRDLDFEMKPSEWWIKPLKGHTKYQGKQCYAVLPIATAYTEALASAALLQSLAGSQINGNSRHKREADEKSEDKQCKFKPYAYVEQGFCFPNGCSDADIWAIIKRVRVPIPGTNVTSQKFCGIKCQKRDLPMTAGAITLSVFLSLWAAVGVASTALDYFWAKNLKPSERGKLIQLLTAFSLYTNGRKILSTEQLPGQIHCIHGIRFLSMTWVILGHAYMDVLNADNSGYAVAHELKRFMNQTWINATVSVDTFFFLSGLLLAFLWFKRMWKTPKLVRSPFAWLLYYVHRYLRLTPIYGFVLVIYVVLIPWMTSGPAWLQNGPYDVKNCRKYWWANMLYVSNLVNPDKMIFLMYRVFFLMDTMFFVNNFFNFRDYSILNTPFESSCLSNLFDYVVHIVGKLSVGGVERCICYGVSWYLNNDMQFHWLAPILLLTFYLTSIGGTILTILLTGGCIAIRAYTTAHYHLQASYTSFGAPDDPLTGGLIANSTWYGWNNLPPNEKVLGNFYNRFMYVAPWTRFAPYILGILFGYFMQRNKTLKIPRVLNLVLWLVAIVSGLAIVYGLYENAQGNALDLWVRAFYAGVCRSAWAILVGWVVVACHYGYGGPINAMLSWRGFIPVSRLTYCAYMTHLFISALLNSNSHHPLHFSNHFDWLAKRYVPMLLIAYVVSFFLSALVEYPVATLESMLFGLCTPKSTSQPKAQPIPPKTQEPNATELPDKVYDAVPGESGSYTPYHSTTEIPSEPYIQPASINEDTPNDSLRFPMGIPSARYQPPGGLWRSDSGMGRYDKI